MFLIFQFNPWIKPSYFIKTTHFYLNQSQQLIFLFQPIKTTIPQRKRTYLTNIFLSTNQNTFRFKQIKAFKFFLMYENNSFSSILFISLFWTNQNTSFKPINQSGSEHPVERCGQCEAGGLRSVSADLALDEQEEVLHRHSLLDGSRGGRRWEEGWVQSAGLLK